MCSFKIQPGLEFTVDSWVYQPLAANAPIDPNSAAVVTELINGLTASQTTMYLFADMPVYLVDATIPTMRVVVQGNPGPATDLLQSQFNAVPVPNSDVFVTEGGTDLEACIYRPATHEMWEGWVWMKTGKKTTNSAGATVDEWAVIWGGYEADLRTNPGWWRTDPATGEKPGMVAIGVPWLAFGITIGDLQQQAINHPVGIIIPSAYVRPHVWNNPPAQRGDGFFDYGHLGVPEGAIFRFPAALDLNQFPITAWDGVSIKSIWRLIAEAMQKYGCIVYDQGGTGIFMSEKGATPQYALNPYLSDPLLTEMGYSADPNATYMALTDFPWAQLQVLQMNLVSG